jgi:chemotaxis signal transduction protein
MAAQLIEAPAHPVAPTALPRAAVEGYLRFTQDGWGYLLPAHALVAVVGAEHIRPLRSPTVGWAGTLSIRGGVVPVLDVAELLGHGGPVGGVLLLRLPSGPLGLAVERLEGIDPLPYTGLQAVPGVVGTSGGLATSRDVPLALSLDHLDALRQLAVAPGSDGPRRTPEIRWELPQRPHTAAAASAGSNLRVGDPLVVLGDRWISDDRCSLALPLRSVRVVARINTVRPVPPGCPALVGLGAWGPRALPLLSLAGLELSSLTSKDPQLAVVLNNGVALMVSGVRGAQGLTGLRAAPIEDQPLLSTLGETMGRRAGERISAGISEEESTARGTPQPIRVAVIHPDRLLASLGE